MMHTVIKKKLERFRFVRLLISIYRMKAVRALVPLLIIGLVYLEGQHELKQIHLGKIIHDLKSVPVSSILLMLGISLLSVAVMSTYDYLIRRHFRLQLGWFRTFRYAWIANTFNNMIGFAGLAGAGLRTLLYKRSNVPTSVLAPAIVFLSPLMITGLSLLGWGTISGLLPADRLMQAHHWLVFAVWGIALYLPLFVLLQRSSLFAKWINRGEGRTAWLTVGASVGASLLEWVFAGLTFWFIAGELLGSVPPVTIFSIYVVAAIAGILSMAPGGIGAFDLIALLGLTQLGFKSDHALAVLVIYRLFYYIIPWLIGLVLAALEFGLPGKKGAERSGDKVEAPLTLWQKIWGSPGQYTFLGDLGVWALGKLVLASGLLLLLSAATPELVYRLKVTEELLSLPVMRISHHLSVLIGFMLILLSRGISLRVHRAYIWTSLLLCGGAVFAVTKGFDYEEALFLLLVALILWISRTRFYRISVPLSSKSILGWLLLTSAVALGYYWLGSYTHHGFLKHLPPGIRPEWLRQHSNVAVTAIGGLIFSWLLLILLAALRPQRKADALAADKDMLRLERFLAEGWGNALSHKLFLGDKSFFWAQEGRVLFAFARVRDKLVVLGDPLGPMSLLRNGISEFRQAADLYGLSVVFYLATPAYLPAYQSQGYRFLKLGEEALVPLADFDAGGLRNASLRSVRSRFEREGYVFEITEALHSAELLRELRLLSEEWLAGRMEKGYALGWFSERYLQQSPLALLRGPGGILLAFASIAPGYDRKKTVSVDLVRHRKDTPDGAMDYLFLCLMEWAKLRGYGSFNLGYAPLFSASCHSGALQEEKLARLVFERGGHGYGFTGLRMYKEKFGPAWEPRYLSYPASVTIPLLTLDLVRLVSRHPEEQE
ncbi:bifunctional lysylphosphatidylglycerol flippase/synthetase MprF [Paenibacillus tritici]|uniref:bifunctional lysylphosphatidylglycerol flippase/synthetase MprF n=1 Tax=Paenibacillus tritici TaxID=1873425 RepID=UPI003CCE6094